MLARFLIILTISIMASGLASAAIYKWVDDEGKVHYSQTPPMDAQSKKMHVPTEAPRNTSTYKRPSLKTDKEDEKDGKAKEQKPAEQQLSSAERAKRCESAKTSLALLNSRGRFRQKDKDGNVTYMTEEEKQQRIKREQEAVNRYCQ